MQSVSVDFHAHGDREASSLAADGAVAQNADGFGGGVFDGVDVAAGPVGLALEVEVVGESVVEGEVGEEDPFGDLGAELGISGQSRFGEDGRGKWQKRSGRKRGGRKGRTSP